MENPELSFVPVFFLDKGKIDVSTDGKTCFFAMEYWKYYVIEDVAFLISSGMPSFAVRPKPLGCKRSSTIIFFFTQKFAMGEMPTRT